MVNFNRRFDRDYAELKRVVDSGSIGVVELIQLATRGPVMPPPQYSAVSGGQLRDQTAHFFDLARWIADLDPTEVFATGSTLTEPCLADYGDVDTSAVTLRLPIGALLQIDSVRRTGYGYKERVEVLGSTGMVEARRQRTGAVSRYSAGKVVDDWPAPRLVRTRNANPRGSSRALRHRARTRRRDHALARRRPQGPCDRRDRRPLTHPR
jgi:myo-inositol 2-dehydrogenase/D-chiro-inositol 1-dehydrogenase